jgi:hypothetical protein
MRCPVEVDPFEVSDTPHRTGSASWCYVAECGDEYASA